MDYLLVFVFLNINKNILFKNNILCYYLNFKLSLLRNNLTISNLLFLKNKLIFLNKIFLIFLNFYILDIFFFTIENFYLFNKFIFILIIHVEANYCYNYLKIAAII